MKTWLGGWLDNIPLASPLQRRQASMLQLALLCWTAIAIFGVAAIMASVPPPSASEPPPPGVMLGGMFLFAALGLLLISPIVALVLLRRGRFSAAVIIASCGILFAHILALITLGFSDPSILIVFQLPIALAGLVAGRRLLWSLTGVSIAVVVAVGYLLSIDSPLVGSFARALGPTSQTSVPMAQVVGFFIAVTFVVTLLLDRFGSALREALASSLDREEELRGIRASLEATVEARTAELRAALLDVQGQAAEQRRLLAEIEQQRTVIQDLSVPVIPISADTLVMPLVGSLDSRRLDQLQEQSLHALERSSARTLVLDITGVPVVDSQVAQGLLMTVRSARLIGARVVLVGIRPEVAQTIVSLGIDLSDIRTFSDLHSALDHVVA
jgi:rsbT co-antagonist protein RsbR